MQIQKNVKSVMKTIQIDHYQQKIKIIHSQTIVQHFNFLNVFLQKLTSNQKIDLSQENLIYDLENDHITVLINLQKQIIQLSKNQKNSQSQEQNSRKTKVNKLKIKAFRCFSQSMEILSKYLQSFFVKNLKINKIKPIMKFQTLVFALSLNCCSILLLYMKNQNFKCGLNQQFKNILKSSLATIKNLSQSFVKDIFVSIDNQNQIFLIKVFQQLFSLYNDESKVIGVQNINFTEGQACRQELIFSIQKIAAFVNQILFKDKNKRKIINILQYYFSIQNWAEYSYEQDLIAYFILLQNQNFEIQVKNFNPNLFFKQFENSLNSRWQEIFSDKSVESINSIYYRTQDQIQRLKIQFGMFQFIQPYKFKYFDTSDLKGKDGHVHNIVEGMVNNIQQVLQKIKLKKSCQKYITIFIKKQFLKQQVQWTINDLNQGIQNIFNGTKQQIYQNKKNGFKLSLIKNPQKCLQYQESIKPIHSKIFKKFDQIYQSYFKNKNQQQVQKLCEQLISIAQQLPRTSVSITRSIAIFQLVYYLLRAIEKKNIKKKFFDNINIYPAFIFKDLFQKAVRFAQQSVWYLQMSKLKFELLNDKTPFIDLHKVQTSPFNRNTAQDFPKIKYNFFSITKENIQNSFFFYSKVLNNVDTQQSYIKCALHHHFDILFYAVSFWLTFLKDKYKLKDEISIQLVVGSSGNMNKFIKRYLENNYPKPYSKDLFKIEQTVVVLRLFLNKNVLQKAKQVFYFRGQIYKNIKPMINSHKFFQECTDFHQQREKIQNKKRNLMYRDKLALKKPNNKNNFVNVNKLKQILSQTFDLALNFYDKYLKEAFKLTSEKKLKLNFNAFKFLVAYNVIQIKKQTEKLRLNDTYIWLKFFTKNQKKFFDCLFSQQLPQFYIVFLKKDFKCLIQYLFNNLNESKQGMKELHQKAKEYLQKFTNLYNQIISGSIPIKNYVEDLKQLANKQNEKNEQQAFLQNTQTQIEKLWNTIKDKYNIQTFYSKYQKDKFDEQSQDEQQDQDEEKFVKYGFDAQKFDLGKQQFTKNGLQLNIINFEKFMKKFNLEKGRDYKKVSNFKRHGRVYMISSILKIVNHQRFNGKQIKFEEVFQ